MTARVRLYERATAELPYGVFYEIVGDETVVLAVAHLERRPGY